MFWELFIAFALAATPWIELLIVIPLGLAWGLPPVPLAIVVVAGNISSLLPVVWLHERWRRWRESRAKQHEGDVSGRWARARRIWNRYGMPGLAMLAPLVTGVHLAAVIALLAGARRKPVLLWLIASIVIWTIGMTVVTLLGIEGVRRIW